MNHIIKKILVAVDFTDKSANALQMGIQMAERHQAEIILFHAISNFSVTDRTGQQIIGSSTVEDHYAIVQKSLEEMHAGLVSLYPEIKFKQKIASDTVLAGVNHIIPEEKVDLLICGTSGKQKLKQTLLGSTSYLILQEAKCSVLLVPENCQKYCFDSIIVPVRTIEDLHDKIELSITIAKKNDGQINLLGLSNEENISRIKAAYNNAKTNIAVKLQQHNSQFILTDRKAEHIAKICKEENADMIILNHYDEDSWKSLFSENFFKQIINRTDVPLLFMKNSVKLNQNYTENVAIDITLPYPG